MATYQTTPETLSAETIALFHQRGFAKIPGIISKEEAAHFRAAAIEASAREKDGRHREVFSQHVNVWREDEAMRALTLHKNVGAVAQKIAGAPMRLWHDHILIKQPNNNVATEFHQDQPYWPHAHSPNALSAWIALCDVPVERGCMSFISGSHRHTGLTAQNLLDGRDLFGKCPELEYAERVTLPLQAGDCTFHHARCAHMAVPNATDEPRVAHVIIFIDQTTTYIKKNHVVTDSLALEEGQVLEGELFPKV
ncbi:MAG: phytanoyl-CoA dioxygenase family protein [Candidatus Latescibacterota bacterium]|jgi:phytanoyl-CoA hydroxylase|tara:strand:+ start:785 stop:1540 length:756 start_codon:yes stop_codon:yes gene_type:complete